MEMKAALKEGVFPHLGRGDRVYSELNTLSP
jgi:hypothetical protein